ncbi:MAG: hypothetical protein NVSMB19_11470 [Vulcanimicrobiaceae bacterium]
MSSNSIRSALAVALLATAPSAARADDLQAFLNDAHRFTAMHSFRLQIDAVAPAGSSTKYITYVAPNKLRVDEPAKKRAVVVIGKLVWLRTADGKWLKEELAPEADPLGAVHDPSVFVKEAKGKSVTFAGVQQIGGVATHVYELAAGARPGSQATSTRVWIGVRDGFPRKIVQRTGPYSSTATYSDLNGALSISGP